MTHSVIPAEAGTLMQRKEKPIYRITIAFKLAMTGTGRHYEYFQAGNDVITHPVIPAKAGTLMQSKEKAYLSHYDCQSSWQ